MDAARSSAIFRALRRSTCARIAPVRAGQADRRAGARVRARPRRRSSSSRRTRIRAGRARRCGRPSPTRWPGITRYPDGNGFALKTALAARFGVEREQIVLGNGSNDILELATQAFLRPGDRSGVLRSTRSAVYPLATQARGATGDRGSRRASWGTTWRRCAQRSPPRTRIVVRRQSEQSDRHLAAPQRR